MAAASLRIPASRTGTPQAPSPHPKQIISLEDWEAKAPLSEAELRSITVIQNALKDKSLPSNEFLVDTLSCQVGSPVPESAGNVNDTLQPGTPGSAAEKTPQGSKQLHPDRPVQTTQEFYEWFSTIERSVAHKQESHYRDHLAVVEKHLDTCEVLAKSVDSVHHDVDRMLDGWRSVETGGRSLKDACEQLLDERDRLIRLTEDIGARLEYFQELEHATRMLNHPGDSLVLQSDFLNMVERVDICIEFLRAHRHYREAEIFLLRFQQCLTRAMTLIKMYFVGLLRALTSDILRRIPDKEISSTAQMHLLYTRFQSVAAQVAPLIGELERRTRTHPDDLSALLEECQSAYFSARRSLLSGRLAEEIKGLDPNRSDLVELTRAGCSYLKQLCIDEFSLYRCFFNSGKDILYAYLESLCDYLYDDLRPRILHEPRLSVLCNVCKVLQALMVLDVPEADSSSDEEETYEVDETSRKEDSQGIGKLHISHMLQSVLQDAQTRLLFKAQNVVQADIRYHVPKPEDIDYPRRLQDASKSPHTADLKTRENDSPFSQIPSFRERGTWYTPLQTLVTVLEQLHEFIQLSIFDDIAEEAIVLCRVNLITAASMIAARSSPAEELDAQLFLIRHLLLLKEMIGVLNLGNRSADGSFEFRHVAETLRDMLRTSSFMPYAFTNSLSKARGETAAGGVKELVDVDLKRACEFVIQLYARSATQPIHDFMVSLGGSSATSSVKKSNSSNRHDEKTPATREAALDTEAEFLATLKSVIPQLADKLTLYLGGEREPDSNYKADRISNAPSDGTDAGTVSVLLGHVQERVVDAYVAFRQAAEFLPADDSNNDGEEASSARKEERAFASPEEIRILFKTLC